MNENLKKDLWKIVWNAVISALVALGTAMGMTSCRFSSDNHYTNPNVNNYYAEPVQ